LDHRTLAGIVEEKENRHEIPVVGKCTICGDLGRDLLVFIALIRTLPCSLVPADFFPQRNNNPNIFEL
jgi:hypothetical protein